MIISVIILGTASERDRTVFMKSFLIWNQTDPGSNLAFDVE